MYAHLSLHVVDGPAGSVGAGAIVGLIDFLNAAVYLVFHLYQNKEARPSETRTQSQEQGPYKSTKAGLQAATAPAICLGSYSQSSGQ